MSASYNEWHRRHLSQGARPGVPSWVRGPPPKHVAQEVVPGVFLRPSFGSSRSFLERSEVRSEDRSEVRFSFRISEAQVRQGRAVGALCCRWERHFLGGFQEMITTHSLFAPSFLVHSSQLPSAISGAALAAVPGGYRLLLTGFHPDCCSIDCDSVFSSIRSRSAERPWANSFTIWYPM